MFNFQKKKLYPQIDLVTFNPQIYFMSKSFFYSRNKKMFVTGRLIIRGTPSDRWVREMEHRCMYLGNHRCSHRGIVHGSSYVHFVSSYLIIRQHVSTYVSIRMCHSDSWYKYRGISRDIPKGLHCSFVLYLEPNFYPWTSRRCKVCGLPMQFVT